MLVARCMLMIGVALFAYCLVLVGQAMPWLGTGALILGCLYMVKAGGKRITTLGSARWADASDVSKAGMLNARSGIILGRLEENHRQ